MARQQPLFDSFALPTVQPRTISYIPRCGTCGLYRKCSSPKMPVYGKGERKVLLVGEAPGCISGDSLVETAFRDKSLHPDGIPIRDLVGKSGFYVYSFDTTKQELVLGEVQRVWKTGEKMVYRVTYEWFYAEGKKRVRKEASLLVTANHPFLLKEPISHDPFKGIQKEGGYLSIEGGLTVGHSLQPFHRWLPKVGYGFVGAFANCRQREARFLLSHKLGRPLERIEECHHKNENKLDDSWENLELLTTASHARHHAAKINPMDRPGVREKHHEIMDSEEYRESMRNKMKEVLNDPVVYTKRLEQIQASKHKTSETVRKLFEDPNYYFSYLKGRQKCLGWSDEEVRARFKKKFPTDEPPVDNHRIISIEQVGVQDVYDMEVKDHHNFAVNGVFVHNSEEDRQGRPFIGKAGDVLRENCSELGVDIDRDCWTTNALICRPHTSSGRNRAPTDKEVSYCRPNLLKTIKNLNPEVIVLLGGAPVKSLISWLWKEDPGGVTRWVGWRIPCQKLNTWIAPTWHPSFVLREREKVRKGEPVAEKYMRHHLGEAFKLQGRPWKEVPDYRKQVRVELDTGEAAKWIRHTTRHSDLIAFDYETNGLTPDSPQREIISCAVSTGKETLSYPWQGEAITATKELLLDPDVGKIGWNCLSGDTKFVTREYGVVSLKDAAGKQVTVLNHEGRWVPATIRSFGQQETVEVTFSRRNYLNTVRATLGHDWISAESGKRLRTEQLKRKRYGGGQGKCHGPDRVAFLCAPKVIDNQEDYFEGIRHGAVLGDGTKTKGRTGAFTLRLCGEKSCLLRYFDGYPKSYPPSYGGEPILYIHGQEVNWKEVPPEGASDSYLIGFARGLLGTDGTVESLGAVSITNKREVIEWCARHLPRVGYWFQSRIDHKKYKGRYTGGYDLKSDSWRLYFTRESLTPDDLLRPSHKKKWQDVDLGPYKFSWLGERRTEEVFCAVVPDGHSFTLDSGLVTGNCKMEDRWSRAKLGIEVANWKFDGMLAAHTLDNRSGICGLKFQSFVRMGQDSYDDAIKPYLRAKAKGAHAPNNIDELVRTDLRTLLVYNGLDALLTFKIALEQAEDLGMPLEASRMSQDRQSGNGTSNGRINRG